MIGIGRHISPLCVAAAALLLLGAAMARGEPEAERSPRADDGPFAAFGRLIDESIAGITSGVKGARDTVDDIGGKAGDAAKAARDATDTVIKLPRTSVAAGHELCATAPNGAPDCRGAIATMCRTKGFESGRSLEVQSEQKCPAEAWLKGRQPTDADCRLDSYVTRALCQ